MQIGQSFTSCAMTVGVYKTGLTLMEREEFKQKFLAEGLKVSKNPGSIFEGKNSLVLCVPAGEETDLVDPMKTGGACVISYGNTGLHSKASLISKMERLNGSWAMAILDDQQGVCLGRDVAGAQTMYYGRIDDGFYFASSLTLFRNLTFTIDMDAISDFLHFLYVPAPRTIYKEVKAVLAGQVVLFDGRKIDEDSLPQKNFRDDAQDRDQTADKDLWLSAYEELLKKSVRMSCPKYEKAALFLSGGKDSSALAIAARNSGLKNIEAVTLGFNEREIDESDDARIVAQHVGMRFRAFKFSRETYLRNWHGFVSCLGQPFGDCAAFPVYVAIREMVGLFDIFLDGTGNDSCLGITTTWHEDLVWHLHRLLPRLHRLPWRFVPKEGSYKLGILARSLGKPREEQFVSWNGWTTEEIEMLTGRRPNWENTSLYRSYLSSSSPMVYKTLTLCKIWEPEAAYRKVVQVANTAGKLVRYPYLDRDLISFSRSLPTVYKYDKRVNKIIIRDLLEKYLPPRIMNKPKGYFIFPKEYILSSRNYENLHVFLSSECIEKHAWVDESIVKKYANQYMKGDDSLKDRIWALVILHAWAEIGRN